MNDIEPEISAEVALFIKRCIQTVSHLECVLLLWETAPRVWTEVDIAIRIGIGSETAGQVVRDLVDHELITRRSEKPASYAFDALNDAAPLLSRVEWEFRLHPVDVTRLIHAKGSPT